MKTALELTVAAQFNADNLVKQQTNQIKRLGHLVSLVSDVGHYHWCVWVDDELFGDSVVIAWVR